MVTALLFDSLGVGRFELSLDSFYFIEILK
jgi:hypothetical protein